MPDPALQLKPATSRPAGRRRAPTKSDLAPWDFTYAPSADGADANLLIMFHGLGDTKAAFAGLGTQLNLPATAVLSLQAPLPVPLMDTPAWSWFNTFDPFFNPLPNPDPSPAVRSLRGLLTALRGLGWAMEDIHLFGWQQGGTVALELALSVAKEPLPPPKITELGDGAEKAGASDDTDSAGTTGASAASAAQAPAARLGSVVSVCGKLESFPSSRVHAATPALWFTRADPRAAATQSMETALRRAFTTLEVVHGEGQGPGMPRSRAEWLGIMRFWGQVLRRADEGWKGGGDVYEVVR